MLNVLLTCVGRRHYLANYFQNSLSGLGKLVGADMDISAPALRACDASCKLPGVFDDHYLDALEGLIINENIDMLFPLNDLEIGLLTRYRDRLEHSMGTTLYVPPRKTFDVCSDKWSTYQFARENNICTPLTFLSIESAVQALASSKVSFPLIVKPRWGSASIGLFVVDCVDDLKFSYTACERAVSTNSIRNLGNADAVVIQEVIKGAEYGVDILYGKNSRAIGFSAKKKLMMRAGETDKAITVNPKPFCEIVDKITAALPHRGNMDCDFLEKDGNLYLLEINPRFGGGYPFTHLSGANHVEMLVLDYLGQPLPAYDYQVGVAFAKYDSIVGVPVD